MGGKGKAPPRSDGSQPLIQTERDAALFQGHVEIGPTIVWYSRRGKDFPKRKDLGLGNLPRRARISANDAPSLPPPSTVLPSSTKAAKCPIIYQGLDTESLKYVPSFSENPPTKMTENERSKQARPTTSLDPTRSSFLLLPFSRFKDSPLRS